MSNTKYTQILRSSFLDGKATSEPHSKICNAYKKACSENERRQAEI